MLSSLINFCSLISRYFLFCWKMKPTRFHVSILPISRIWKRSIPCRFYRFPVLWKKRKRSNSLKFPAGWLSPHATLSILKVIPSIACRDHFVLISYKFTPITRVTESPRIRLGKLYCIRNYRLRLSVGFCPFEVRSGSTRPGSDCTVSWEGIAICFALAFETFLQLVPAIASSVLA